MNPTDDFASEPPHREEIAAAPQDPGMARIEHPTALAAYYTGIFALFPGSGLFMGPAALVLGLKALAAIQGDSSATGRSRALAAVVMGVATTAFNWGAVLYFLIAWSAAPR